MIEIDLQKLERGAREGWVMVKRGGKVFRRRQRVGQKENIEYFKEQSRNDKNSIKKS